MPGIVLDAGAIEMTDVWFQYSGSSQSVRAVIGKEDGKNTCPTEKGRCYLVFTTVTHSGLINCGAQHLLYFILPEGRDTIIHV